MRGPAVAGQIVFSRLEAAGVYLQALECQTAIPSLNLKHD
jgi:hypothetical protein